MFFIFIKNSIQTTPSPKSPSMFFTSYLTRLLIDWLACTFFIFLLGCASQMMNTADENVPYINPKDIGNVRVAILGKESTVVLVNRSNRDYLSLQDFAKEENREDAPASSLKYKASELTYSMKTVIVIVDDDVMAKLLGLFEKYAFESFAESCNRNYFSGEQWQERDGIFLEQNQDWKILLRGEKLTNEFHQATPKGQTYRTLKNYILQAHATGYRPTQVLYNTDGKGLFQRNQRSSGKP